MAITISVALHKSIVGPICFFLCSWPPVCSKKSNLNWIILKDLFIMNCITVSVTVSVVISARRDRRGRGRMVVAFTTTYATSAYHH